MRDTFIRTPDGEIILQAWVSFIGRDEASLTYEDLNHTVSFEEAERFRTPLWAEIEAKKVAAKAQRRKP